jgi:Rab GDP dissociation inhibitor
MADEAELGPLADGAYDVIVLGTGLKECILSGLLSVAGKKVLHMDRNDYYGGASASITPLEKLFEKYKKEGMSEAKFGRGRDWNVDLIPKLIMANGLLVKMLIHTDVTRYLEFKSVEGSYVFKSNPDKLYKVPVTGEEALASSLMGLFEKRRFRKFLIWAHGYNEEDQSTWSTLPPNTPMHKVFAYFGLDKNTADFSGHSIMLYPDDTWMSNECRHAIKRIKLYSESLARYGKSPYIYPLYGLGELPQGFARLSAIYGGTYMLNHPIQKVLFDDAGSFAGVVAEGQKATAPIVIADPSYFPDRCKKVGAVARCICILSHPVPNTRDSLSCQIILPAGQIARKNDIYISVVSHTHNVASSGKFLAIVSTTVETANPRAELAKGIALLGPIDESFFSVDDLYEPTATGEKDKVFITTSYDASSHFETTCLDILDVFKRVTGEDVDLSKPPPNQAEQVE